MPRPTRNELKTQVYRNSPVENALKLNQTAGPPIGNIWVGTDTFDDTGMTLSTAEVNPTLKTEAFPKQNVTLTADTINVEGDFYDYPRESLEMAANVGEPAAEILGNVPDDQGIDWLGNIKAAGQWIKANPWSVTVPLDIASGIFKGKAIKEEARATAIHLREQGRLAFEKAKRESRDVEIEHEFEEEDNIEKYKQTGLFSGEESFERGTGVQGLLTANKNAAKQLMEDILTEGRRQQQAYETAATATERAAKKSAKYAAIGTAGKVAGKFLGG